MTSSQLQQRSQLYFKLSSQIAQIDQAQLRSLFDASVTGAGWGSNHVIELQQTKVFVKRVPLTALEYEHMFSTRNLYELPGYYNYGVGSAGFGAFREVVAHIKTTNWVLGGEAAGFPLLYHYRIIPYAGPREELDLERHNNYVKYWGGSEQIGRYMLARAQAEYELVLFLEYIPWVLHPWLLEHQQQVEPVLADLRATIDFLRGRGIIHFDVHFHNILTDGQQTYLSDFGLLLDRSFALTQAEQAFFEAHTHYDYGELLACLIFLLADQYDALPDAGKRAIMSRYDIPEAMPPRERLLVLLDHVEELAAEHGLPLDPCFVATLVRYRSVIKFMRVFYGNLRSNSSKDTPFDHAQLCRLLRDTKFVVSSF